MRQVSTSFCSSTNDVFPSTIGTPTFTMGRKSIKTCKVISLRSGKEYEGPCKKSQYHQDVNKKPHEESLEAIPKAKTKPSIIETEGGKRP